MLSLISKASSFEYLTTCITETRLHHFPACSSLVVSSRTQYLQVRHNCNVLGMGKVNGDIQSQPQMNPILQKSVCHTRLYQWDSHSIPYKAGLDIFLNGTLPYEADNLTCIFIEKYISSHNCLLLYSIPKCILCS